MLTLLEISHNLNRSKALYWLYLQVSKLKCFLPVYKKIHLGNYKFSILIFFVCNLWRVRTEASHEVHQRKGNLIHHQNLWLASVNMRIIGFRDTVEDHRFQCYKQWLIICMLCNKIKLLCKMFRIYISFKDKRFDKLHQIAEIL